MRLHVCPDDIAAAGARLAGDGDLLRALALLVATARAAGRGAPAPLAATRADVGERVPAALRTLGEATDLLAAGLRAAGRGYADAEDRAAALGRRLVLG